MPINRRSFLRGTAGGALPLAASRSIRSAGGAVKITPGARDVFIVVDVQNSFIPGGSLAVPRGDEVVPIINRLAAGFQHVVMTQDWHTQGRISFASSHPGAKPPKAELIIRKGYCENVDSYSAFYEADGKTPTGLGGYLKQRGLKRIFIAGLATDFCICFTALDARKEGFAAYVIEDACRGIDAEGSLAASWAKMKKSGVQRVQSADLAIA